jgi:hypothetical protein
MRSTLIVSQRPPSTRYEGRYLCLKCEVHTVLTTKMTAFLDMMPYSLIGTYEVSEKTYCLRPQIWKVVATLSFETWLLHYRITRRQMREFIHLQDEFC